MSRRRVKNASPQPASEPPDPCAPAGQGGARAGATVILALALVVGATVVGVHWPVLSKQAISTDDEEYLTDNPLVKNPGWASAGRFLREVLEPSSVQGYYQPLAMISLMLDYALAGSPENLRPFRRTSLFLHAVNSILVMLLLYQLFGNAWVAAGLGLLFGAHPITVEPTAWIADRKTLLATFFALGCLILYVQHARAESSSASRGSRRGLPPSVGAARQARRYLLFSGCVLAFVLSLLSKPTGTALPLLLLLLDYWPLRRLSKRAVVEKAPFLIVAAVSAMITYVSQSRTAGVLLPGHAPESGPARAPLILAHNIVFYLYKIVWPTNMSAHYPVPKPLDLSQSMVLAGVVGTVALLVVLAVTLRWTRALMVGWLSFFLVIFPTMGIIGFTTVVAADKFAYLPIVGLLLPMAAGLNACWHNGAGALGVRRTRIGMVGAVLVLAVAEAGVTRRFLNKWRDSETLFRYMVAVAPHASVPHYGLGNVLRMQARFDEAIAEYRASLRREPRHAQAHINLANALAHQKHFDEAIAHYRLVLQSRPDHFETLNNLANTLVAQGRLEEAIPIYERVLKLRPGSEAVQQNLDFARARQRQLDEFVVRCQRMQAIDPQDAAAHVEQARKYLGEGHFEEAATLCRHALRIKPGDFTAQRSLGLILFQQGVLEEAVTHLERAADAQPDDVEVRVGLASALGQRGQPLAAAEHYRAVLRLRPELIAVANNLAWLLATHEGATPAHAAEAIQIAERACQQTSRQQPGLLDTLAAAYAAAGRFSEAVEAARQAIALAASAGQTHLADEIRGRLKLYESGQFYREPAPLQL
jgi:tetratricopeptide (TPR) repeat protein